MSESRTSRRFVRRRTAALVIAASLAAACVDDGVAPPGSRQAPTSQPRVLGFVDLTFDDIGTPDMSPSVLAAPSIAELEALRAERDRLRESGEDVALDLTFIGPGNGTIQFGSGTGARFTDNGLAYLHATFPVRNAQLNGTPYDTERTNLTLLAVSTNNTLEGSAVRTLRLGDSSPADPALALDVMPTGLVELDNDSLVSVNADVVQVLTEAEVGALDLPAGVTSIFPYAFIVRNATSNSTRTLPASPDTDQGAGGSAVAFSIPLQSNSNDDPQSMSFTLVAVDDSETRLTQSLQEQTPPAQLALQQRAGALDATTVTLLPGGTVPGWSDLRTICSVRTAGTANEPAAHLVNVFWEFGSFIPDPYIDDGSSSFIPSTTSFQAAFSAELEGAGPENFTVRGLQSGPAFLGQSYDGNGTSTIATPPGSFVAGEEVEIALTNALACPQQPPVVRYRVAAGQSTGSFGPDSTYGTGMTPTSVAVGDLTGNGVLDAVTTNPVAFDENLVSVLLGNGNGTFQDHQTLDVARSPEAVAVGDLNGDGNLDVVTANSGANNISVLLGNGNGTFQTQQTFGVGNTPMAVAIADLNGNAVLDVVVANIGATNISVLLGNGDGTFQPQQTFAAGAEPGSVAIGDLNADGVLDVVAANFATVASAVSVLLGNGDGTFQAPQTINMEHQLSHVAIGDLNNNGNLDLAVANFPPGVNTVSTLLGNGDGSFSPGATLDVGNRPSSIAIGDLTGDGALDLVVANAASQHVSVLLGDGNGNFQTQQTFDVGSEPLSVVVGDLTGNGILDVVTANLASNNISVLLAQP